MYLCVFVRYLYVCIVYISLCICVDQVPMCDECQISVCVCICQVRVCVRTRACARARTAGPSSLAWAVSHGVGWWREGRLPGSLSGLVPVMPQRDSPEGR